MKKLLSLTFLVLVLVIIGCKASPTDLPADSTSEIEALDLPEPDKVTLLVEFTTTSDLSDLIILNPDMVLSMQLVSTIGEPSYMNLEPTGLAIDQSLESAESGGEVGLLVRFELETATEHVLELELHKGCIQESAVTIYHVLQNEPSLIYQRTYPESEGCEGISINLDLNPQLALQDQIIEDANRAAEEELEVTEEFPATIQAGIEIEIITRSDLLYMEFLNPEIIGKTEFISYSGDVIRYEFWENLVYLDQTIMDAELGKRVALNFRLALTPEAAGQMLEFKFDKGCLNDSSLRFYSVVDGEKEPILFPEGEDIARIDHCNSVLFHLDPTSRQVSMEVDLLSRFHIEDDGPPDGDYSIIEIDFSTSSDHSSLDLLNSEGIHYAQYQSYFGEPGYLDMREDYLSLDQALAAAGSGKVVGIRARYWVDNQAETQVLKYRLQKGCLGESSVRFYVIQDEERLSVPMVDGEQIYQTDLCDPVMLQLDLETVAAVIEASESFDDLPLVGTLTDIQGEVLVRQPGMFQFSQAWEGNPLNPGGQVLTGTNSEVYLSISDGAVIRLGSNTIFSLDFGLISEEIVLPRFKLDLGEMRVVSGGGGLLVDTPHSVVGAVGSAADISVSPGGSVDITCLSGDCFQYDGSPKSEIVLDQLPEIVAIAVEQSYRNNLSGLSSSDDSDDDGITIEYDLCPEEGDLGNGVDLYGCPVVIITGNDDAVVELVPSDYDGDGYADYEDFCPTVYAPMRVQELTGASLGGNHGCPWGDFDFDGIADWDECETVSCDDNDGDGQMNDEDLCPEIHGSQSNHGCPTGDDNFNGIRDEFECDDCPLPTSVNPERNNTDTDNDGIPNIEDECPIEDSVGYGIDENGCPIPLSDRDGDGVHIDIDLCPDEGDLGYGVDAKGCPILLTVAPPLDSDGDGYSDEEDLCPTIYSPRLYFEWDQTWGTEFYGCPQGDYDFDGEVDPIEPPEEQTLCEIYPWECPGGDYDGDGVENMADQCPTADEWVSRISDNELGFVIVEVELEDGCPTGYFDGQGIPHIDPDPEPQDADNDEVYDQYDACPEEGSDGFGVDEFGCPLPPRDSDGDGVPDMNDLCVFEGSRGAGVDGQGCPYYLIDIDFSDWDGDGYPDYEDQCPEIYAPKVSSLAADLGYHYATYVDFYGCPSGDFDFNGVPDSFECDGADCDDSDGDGFNDDEDLCPNVYSIGETEFRGDYYTNFGCPIGDNDHNGVPDNKECQECEYPESQDIDQCIDRDHDGICFEDDLCPFKAGKINNQGCEEGDSDGDGVRDGLDLCPGQGDSGFGVTLFGCPKPLPDGDGDGVGDLLDRCPTMGDLGQGLNANGCPQSAADQDGDGFTDSFDNCPAQGDQGNGLDSRGCPIMVSDNDGDGVIDALDKCPNQGDQGSGLRNNGCPKTASDGDNDGVTDVLDKCPNQGDQGNGVDNKGCPLTEQDSDNDGVPDNEDLCPNDGDLGYGVNRSGCPISAPDSDGDGVTDNLDRCPLQGDQGYGLTSSGCPNPPPDGDGDGVIDAVDRCPDEGDLGFGIDRSGCPLADPNPPAAPDGDEDGVPDEKDLCPTQDGGENGVDKNGCPLIN